MARITPAPQHPANTDKERHAQKRIEEAEPPRHIDERQQRTGDMRVEIIMDRVDGPEMVGTHHFVHVHPVRRVQVELAPATVDRHQQRPAAQHERQRAHQRPTQVETQKAAHADGKQHRRGRQQRGKQLRGVIGVKLSPMA